MNEVINFCGNCKTERYGIFCRGYCRRCYRLIIQQEQIARWDLQNPATLKRFPSIGVYSERHLEEEFPKTKAARLKELEYRLWLLKTHEAQRNEEVTGFGYRTLPSPGGQVVRRKGRRCVRNCEHGQPSFRSRSTPRAARLAIRHRGKHALGSQAPLARVASRGSRKNGGSESS